MQTYKSTSASSPVLEQGRGFSGDGSHSYGPQEAYTSPLNHCRRGVPTPSSQCFHPNVYALNTDELPNFQVWFEHLVCITCSIYLSGLSYAAVAGVSFQSTSQVSPCCAALVGGSVSQTLKAGTKEELY
jgi:hypothetical protein